MRALILVGASLVLACGSPTWTQSTTVNKPRKHVMIEFTDASLHPSEAHVLQGGNVAWINYSTMYVGVVFLTMETAQAMGCKHMRPLFTEVVGGYQSLEIAEDSEDATLPCSPAPGTYPYELRLSQAMEQGNYEATMNGSIVVEATP